MLSILVYGRNDSHGYNLHKRVALSLNAIAPLLTEPSDEIVFVDYNTSSDLPTFVDAIRDTLTSDALARLRVIRVPAWVHEERFAKRTRLAALEPVARNVGLRRSNPDNRWILSTNTDMLFVPHQAGRSLTEMVAALADGYYALPRYDIPEALWESMDRRDPQTNLDLLREWGPGLHLDSIVLSFPYNGFDAPGDFQLVGRDRLFEIDAFDEEMLHGWHVDSNIFKRLSLVYGKPGDLSHELSGYHCDHTRLATAVHRTGGIQNDLHRFVENVDRPDIPAQRDSWGLADLELEEVDLGAEATTRFASALAKVVPPAHEQAPVVDSLDSFEVMDYDPAHVLPYLVDPLTVLPARSTIAYVGVNTALAGMLATFLRELGFTQPLQILDIEGAPTPEGTDVVPLDTVATGAAAVVFDFGLLPLPGTTAPDTIAGWPRPVRWRLSPVLDAFDSLIAHDLANPDTGNPRRYLAVNSRATLFEPFFTSRLVTTTTPYNTRTQHGFVAEIPQADIDAVFTPAVRAALGSYFGYQLAEGGCGYTAGSVMDFTIGGQAGRYENEGWSIPEETGTWTVGDTADLVFELTPPAGGAPHGYVCTVESTPFLMPPDHCRQETTVRINGAEVGTLAFEHGVAHPTASSFLVAREVVESTTPARLELAIRTPMSPASLGVNRDGRRLGLKVRSVVVRPRELRLALGERRPLDSSAVTDCLAGGWSYEEPTGIWTDGASAELLVVPTAVPPGVAVDLAVEIRDAMLTPAHRALTVRVEIDGVPATRWDLHEGEPRHHVRRARLGTADGPDPLTIALVVDEPARPVDLGIGPDTRALGLMVAAISLIRSDAPDPPIREPRRLSKALVQRATSLVSRRGTRQDRQ